MKILYNIDNNIVILMPNIGILPIQDIARKDVPYGIPYLIVEDSALPLDWSTSTAWEVDFSTPDGYGLGPHRWFIQKAEAEIAEGLNIEANQALIAQMQQELAVNDNN